LTLILHTALMHCACVQMNTPIHGRHELLTFCSQYYTEMDFAPLKALNNDAHRVPNVSCRLWDYINWLCCQLRAHSVSCRILQGDLLIHFDCHMVTGLQPAAGLCHVYWCRLRLELLTLVVIASPCC